MDEKKAANNEMGIEFVREGEVGRQEGGIAPS